MYLSFNNCLKSFLETNKKINIKENIPVTCKVLELACELSRFFILGRAPFTIEDVKLSGIVSTES